MTASPAPIVRFAPSPTGLLHVGNIRTAILNWLFARKAGGTFLLRLDDTDRDRSTEAFANAIGEDLAWLGLTWDRYERQSAREARYVEVAEQLRAKGLIYACYETEDELDRRRRRQRARGLPPIYDRAGLKLTPAERSEFEAAGRRPHWRFQLPNTEARSPLAPVPTLVTWNDLIRGDQTVDLGSLSDPVLIRADGSFLYTFTSVVDDVDFAITHVIRGEDHVTNAGVQVALLEALGARPPAFAHHSLLVGRDGEPLSKRLGALSIASLRAEGLEPMAVCSHAALVGTSENIAAHSSLDALAALFDFEKISRAPARFDPEELVAVNAALLHQMSYAEAAPRLAAAGIGGGAPFWEAVRANLVRFTEVAGWWQVVAGDVEPMAESPALLAAAASRLPPEPWDATTWGSWTKAVAAETGAKGRALFHPLRLALTGRDTGPELKALLPLIGRERALKRLQAAAG